ncbi:hypothetical protein ACFL6R_01215 [Gemmatimonadota bacterium]
MNNVKHLPAVLGVLFLVACGSRESSPEPLILPQPEVFTWTDHPIEFSPPPTEWDRHRSQQTLLGARFQIPRVPPGRIIIGEYHLLLRGHSRIPAWGRERRFEPPLPGFTLADVVDRVRFDPLSLPPPGSVTVQPEVDRMVGGVPAVSLDYTWNDGTHDFYGREVYFLVGEHLFAATLFGIEEDLELFEQIVSTIRFPSPPPETR